MQVEFVLSSAEPAQFPADGLPEIAFLGRSNVGKSSLINSLVGQKGLAFTSSTPGHTQTINFFRIEQSYYLVDLPGYGYARIGKNRVRAWKGLVDSYLVRDTLRLCFVILDVRRGWMEPDLQLKQWLEYHNRRFVVIATKMDKLKSRLEQERGLAAIRKDGAEPLPFSAVTGRGVRELWQTISTTLRNP